MSLYYLSRKSSSSFTLLISLLALGERPGLYPYVFRCDGDAHAVTVVPHVIGIDEDILVPVGKHRKVVMVSLVKNEFHFTQIGRAHV